MPKNIGHFTNDIDQVKYNFTGVKEAMGKGTSPEERLQKGFIAWLEGPKEKELSTPPTKRLLEIIEFAQQKETEADDLIKLFMRQLGMFDKSVTNMVWFLDNKDEYEKMKAMELSGSKEDKEKWREKIFDIEYGKKHKIMKDCAPKMDKKDEKMNAYNNDILIPIMDEYKKAKEKGDETEKAKLKEKYNTELNKFKVENAKNPCPDLDDNIWKEMEEDSKTLFRENYEGGNFTWVQVVEYRKGRDWNVNKVMDSKIEWLKLKLDNEKALSDNDKKYYEALALESEEQKKQMKIAKSKATTLWKHTHPLIGKGKWKKMKNAEKMFKCTDRCKGGRRKSRRKSRRRRRTKKKRKRRRKRTKKKRRRRRR
jgi:hypothetical protein